jgi:hypothetical protein
MNRKAETKNHASDLTEYILLISFVCIASSYAVVSEVLTARDMRKTADRLQLLEAPKGYPQGDIFSKQTKRHIK